MILEPKTVPRKLWLGVRARRDYLLHPCSLVFQGRKWTARERKCIGQGQWPGDGSVDVPASVSGPACIIPACHAT